MTEQFNQIPPKMLNLILSIKSLLPCKVSHRFWRLEAKVAQMVKNLLVMQETLFGSLGQKFPLGRERQHTPVFLPREFHWQTMDSDITEWLTLSSFLRIGTSSEHWTSLRSFCSIYCSLHVYFANYKVKFGISHPLFFCL